MPVGPGASNNNGPNNNDKEEMNQYMDLKVQIIFSSISYSKFLKQKAKSTTFITNDKGGSASDYFLYCLEDWPAKAYMYNDPVDEVIFIDCGSDDFGSAKKNGNNEQVLRKYTSFAVMRLKDMLYRRSQLYNQRGQVHCMILSISPFHKCMMAMSALLQKMLTDSDIYMSFIADVIGRPEYRYTFNWIRSYGWSIDVYYNAAFSPYKGRIECNKSPKMKLGQIDRLLSATTHYGKIGNKMPYVDNWVDRKYKKDDDGNVMTGGEKQNGSKQKITFYDKTEKEDTTYDGEEITVTEWVPQANATEVWVPEDPKVQRWQDPDTGKLLVRYEGQIYERDYLYDYWESAVHPNYDQLKQRIGDTKQKYDEASKRADETFERAVAAQEAGDSKYTEEYINHEVDNLVKKSGMAPEEAKEALAEQGFIPKNDQGKTMYYLDGRMMTNDGLLEIVNAANEASMKALKDYLNAQKALEQKKNSDILFCLNMASLVVGVVSFGATSVIAAGVMAVVDIGLNVTIVGFQIKGASIDGKGVMDAFGSSTGERVFNIAVTGIAIVADVISIVPLFKGPKGIPKSSGGTQHAAGSQSTKTNTHTQASNSTLDVTQTTEAPKVQETQKVKTNSSSTRKVTNANGETEWHTTVTHEDGRVEVIKRDKNGNQIIEEKWERVNVELRVNYDEKGNIVGEKGTKETWRSNWGGEKTVKKDLKGNITEENIEKKGTPKKVSPKKANFDFSEFSPETLEVDAIGFNPTVENKPSLYVNEKGEIQVIDSNGNEHKALGIGQSKHQARTGGGESKKRTKNRGEKSPFGKLNNNGEKAYVKVAKEDGKGFDYIEIDRENAINIQKTYKDKSTWGKKPESKPTQSASNEVDTVSGNTEQTAATEGDNVSSSSTENANGNNGTDGSGGSNADDADNPIVKDEKTAQDVDAEGGGNASSNTGNADQLVVEVKKSWWGKTVDNFGRGPIVDIVKDIKKYKDGAASGKELAKSLSIDFAKTIFTLDHWLCIGVVIKSLVDYNPFQQDEYDLDDEDIKEHDKIDAEGLVDTSAKGTYERTSAELERMKLDGDVNSQLYYDTVFVNEAAENAVGAQKKVAALKEYYETDAEIQRIEHETGGFSNQHYMDLVEKRDAARQTITNYDAGQANAAAANAWGGNIMDIFKPAPNNDDFNNKYKNASDQGLAIAQAEAEAQGAEADLEMEKYLALYNQKQQNQ